MINENHFQEKEVQPMETYRELSKLVSNDLLSLKASSFDLGPKYRPADLTPERLEVAPLSFIIGEHPSEYAMSPVLWNAEYQMTGRSDLFLPADIHAQDLPRLFALLDYALEQGSKHFRVLTITNPHKVEAYKHFIKRAAELPGKIEISEDAMRIGATNQVLIGPDDVFHVINSDGRGMANSVDNFLAVQGQGDLGGKQVGVIGAGGAGRGIIYEVAKRVAAKPMGRLTIFNRTVEKAEELVREFSGYFPELRLKACALDDLSKMAIYKDALISSITSGDPLLDSGAYQDLQAGTLIVDANYGANSVLAGNAKLAGRSDLAVHDGSGMIFEGYRIPSQELAELWGYEVPEDVYQKIAALLGYDPASK
jgi:shikimate 5-dehydrogenase